MSQINLHGQMVVYSRLKEIDYDFVKEIGDKQCWGKYNQALRLCVRFARKNREEFEKFIGKLREEFE